MLVFSTGFVNYFPSNLLPGLALPLSHLPCMNKFTVYTYTQCVRGGGTPGERGFIGGEGASDRYNTRRKVPLRDNFFR